MRGFKGYNTNNDRREQVLNNLERLFVVMNKTESHSGSKAENSIADRYKVAFISELSTSTLINEYERLLNTRQAYT